MSKIEAIDTDSTILVSRAPAYTSFDFNTDKLMHLIQFIGRRVQGISQEANLSRTESILFASSDLEQESNIEESRGRAKNVSFTEEQVIEIKQEISNYAESLNAHFSGLVMGLELVLVLIVTIVEAYLVDVLVYAASTDPTFMKKSEMAASYSEVTSASSLEELLQNMRCRWARNFINEGGPKHWIHNLMKMGARGYSSELTKEMETLWGIRHLTVHSTGIATPDFVRRHPEFGGAVGEKIQVNLSQLQNWTNHIYRFVDVTDAYFAQRCKLQTTNARDYQRSME